MDHPIPRYSSPAFQFNLLLDQGQSMTIDEVRWRLSDGSFFNRLEELYRREPYYLDLSLYDEGERRTILKVFKAMSDNIDEDRKLGVRHNGLAMCLAYCIENMRDPKTMAIIASTSSGAPGLAWRRPTTRKPGVRLEKAGV